MSPESAMQPGQYDARQLPPYKMLQYLQTPAKIKKNKNKNKNLQN
jgi:hypothetical protein